MRIISLGYLGLSAVVQAKARGPSDEAPVRDIPIVAKVAAPLPVPHLTHSPTVPSHTRTTIIASTTATAPRKGLNSNRLSSRFPVRCAALQWSWARRISTLARC
jgi:hypothetical protein